MNEPAAPAAWVGHEVVTRAEVAAELARLRAGPLGAWLPADGTAEGRQFRRWVTQRLVLRRLLERERDARGLDAEPAALPAVRPDAAVLGSAAADVLATSGAARAVFAAVTGEVSVSDDEVRACYAANPERFQEPARWLVRHAFDPSDPAALPQRLPSAPAVLATPDSLPPTVHAAADAALRAAGGPPVTAGPVRSAVGWHLLAVDAEHPAATVPYATARPRIAADLLDRARQLAFARWLDARAALLVRLAPGYEHPADPRQPDATHRH
jgi:[acyl-carrier-protein] S-malonyltransferase